MSGFVIGEVDSLLISEDGVSLPVAPDVVAPTSPRALLVAGVEPSSDSDVGTVRLLKTGPSGGVALDEGSTATNQAILMTLGSILSQLQRIGDSLESLAEE